MSVPSSRPVFSCKFKVNFQGERVIKFELNMFVYFPKFSILSAQKVSFLKKLIGRKMVSLLFLLSENDFIVPIRALMYYERNRIPQCRINYENY